MTAEPSRQPARTAHSSRTCLICGAALSPSQQRYCTRACQQQAYRLRQRQPSRLDLVLVRAELKRRRQLTEYTVYECPACETRCVGEQRLRGVQHVRSRRRIGWPLPRLRRGRFAERPPGARGPPRLLTTALANALDLRSGHRPPYSLPLPGSFFRRKRGSSLKRKQHSAGASGAAIARPLT